MNGMMKVQMITNNNFFKRIGAKVSSSVLYKIEEFILVWRMAPVKSPKLSVTVVSIVASKNA